MKKFILIVLVAFLLLWYFEPEMVNSFITSTKESVCSVWPDKKFVVYGKRGIRDCVDKFPDGEIPCNSGAECISKKCVASVDWAYVEKVVGHCKEDGIPSCYKCEGEIIDGKVTGECCE